MFSGLKSRETTRKQNTQVTKEIIRNEVVIILGTFHGISNYKDSRMRENKHWRGGNNQRNSTENSSK